MTDNQQSPVKQVDVDAAEAFCKRNMLTGPAWRGRVARLLARQRLPATGPDVGLREALAMLLARDVQNTCQHEDTHRGGVLWEICDGCGARWADDEGGKPTWTDPPEWIAARAALEPRTADGGEVERREMAQAIADRLYPSGDKAANSRNYIAYNAALAALRSHAEGME